jgi:hypothetical protein
VAGDEDRGPGIWIESTRGPEDEPVCLLTIGPHQSWPPVDDVRQTALDLVTCAAYAEMMLTLIIRVGLPPEVVGQFTTDLLSGLGRPFFGARSTLTMLPAGATRRSGGPGSPRVREAVVLLHRGSTDAAITAAEAREMALKWLAAAEATESDQLVSGALDAIDVPAEVQTMLFAYLHARRSDQPEDLAGQAGEAGD